MKMFRVLKSFSVDNGTKFDRGGDGVIEVHVERVACKRAGCHESGTH